MNLELSSSTDSGLLMQTDALLPSDQLLRSLKESQASLIHASFVASSTPDKGNLFTLHSYNHKSSIEETFLTTKKICSKVISPPTLDIKEAGISFQYPSHLESTSCYKTL